MSNKCADLDCKSVNAKFTNKMNGKKYCRNHASLMQYRANHLAFLNKSEPVKLFDEHGINLLDIH